MFCCCVIMETNRFGNSLCGHGLIGGFTVQYCRREPAALSDTVAAVEMRREARCGWKRVAFMRGRNIVAVFEQRRVYEEKATI